MIPFVQLDSENKKKLLPSILDEIGALYQSSQFILGPIVEQFEKKLALSIGCHSVVSVNSGLDALILSLRAAGVGAGDEVITAPNSFLASASAIELTGARVVFADIGPDYNLDPQAVEKKITARTKAILLVHLTGTPCDMDPFLAIHKKYGVELIEDAAQAIGATYRGKQVGNFGRFGCFSLHPLKNLHVWGDGGFITLHSEEDRKTLVKLRNHGLINRNETETFSMNSRLDSMQAIVGSHFLSMLEETTVKRRSNAAFYQSQLGKLGPEITLPYYDPKTTHPVFHVFQIRCQNRAQWIEKLTAKGIETKIHYPIPIHLQPACLKLGFKRGDFPVTEQFSEQILSLPVRENLTAEERNQIVSVFTA